MQNAANAAPVGRRNRSGAGPPAFIWLPAAAVALLMLLPPVYLLVRAAESGTAALDILLSGRTLAILIRTVVLVGVVTAACAVLGVALAWLTLRTDLPFRRAFGVLTALPLAIPSYVFALLVIATLSPKGMLQGWLEPLGVERLPSLFGLPGAAFTLILLSFPYVALPVKAALRRIDPATEEAARSLGRSARGAFFHVTLPLLRPAIVSGSLLVALYTLSDFGAVSLLRYQTFTWAIFIQYETAFDRSVAAALSLALTGLALALLVAESRSRGRAAYHRATPGAQREPQVVRLGRWRWPAAAFAGGVVALSLAAPVAVLGYWVVRGVSAGEPLDLLWSNALNTVYVSALAAGAAAIGAAPVALLSARHPGWAASLLERLAYVGFALPGLAVALAFVFFGASVLTPLYQTTLLLIAAYVTLFLPASLGATQTALRQVSPRLEEAARSLGKTPFHAFRLTTLPLLSRGAATGAALVFLLTMKELPATLILAPTEFRTLATSVWSAASEAFFARAAAPAILLIFAAGVPAALLTLRERRD